jgi:hypothetical protein
MSRIRDIARQKKTESLLRRPRLCALFSGGFLTTLVQMKAIYLLPLVILWALWATESFAAPAIGDFQVQGPKGESGPLHGFFKTRFLVLVASGSSCPILRKYVARLASLNRVWKKKEVTFYFLSVAKHDEMPGKDSAEKARFGANIPVLKDVDQKLARALNLKALSETVLYDRESGAVAYQGAIDDSITFEGQRATGVKHYLEDALKAVTTGREPTVKSSSPFGCAITYNK